MCTTKNIHVYELKKYLHQKLHNIYVLLGENNSLLKKNQNIIQQFAFKKGFINTITIDIEKNQDWEKVILTYKIRNLFFQKTILVINLLIKNINTFIFKKIYKIFNLFNSDILTILKFHHLSNIIKNSIFFKNFQKKNYIISCYTPYNIDFILWIKYEIKERNIKMSKQAFLLLCKYYDGNTLYILNVLDMIFITFPNTYIELEMIKQIIVHFLDYSSLNWINYIFQFKTQKAISILSLFSKKKYNPLILVRSLQIDLTKLVYIKREKNININQLLKKHNICTIRHKFFIHAIHKINYFNLLKAITILLKIEINIKNNYNHFIWYQLKELTLTLNHAN
ncbi:DNA polymerase III subunit delta [Buchnera aphidicola]|uniref:DNA polymerase III subunit delta n=1 Tax=Buchnera aphidicola subsp. Uroleucon sonchi TaxID=118118 RepID=A0A6C1FHR8_BUCUN|nr:DNA polymerase III subunit delta [Buchnera aphidicola]QIE02135.1 DNA polymerase III subunit delta [Buchnera aphidicola (Uroleucon sonchi)]